MQASEVIRNESFIGSIGFVATFSGFWNLELRSTEGNVEMRFDEGRHLTYLHCDEWKASTPAQSAEAHLALQAVAEAAPSKTSTGAYFDWKPETTLDLANNKIQELMQLLYLLSRDTRVPQQARYHVTIAQSEIALLTKIVQNATGPAVPVENESKQASAGAI